MLEPVSFMASPRAPSPPVGLEHLGREAAAVRVVDPQPRVMDQGLRGVGAEVSSGLSYFHKTLFTFSPKMTGHKTSAIIPAR